MCEGGSLGTVQLEHKGINVIKFCCPFNGNFNNNENKTDSNSKTT